MVINYYYLQVKFYSFQYTFAVWLQIRKYVFLIRFFTLYKGGENVDDSPYMRKFLLAVYFRSEKLSCEDDANVQFQRHVKTFPHQKEKIVLWKLMCGVGGKAEKVCALLIGLEHNTARFNWLLSHAAGKSAGKIFPSTRDLQISFTRWCRCRRKIGEISLPKSCGWKGFLSARFQVSFQESFYCDRELWT